MDKIDAIIYINLHHRVDRNEHILKEIKKLCIDESKIHRIDAFYLTDDGALGATISHTKAFKYMLKHPEWKNCLILEDDFTFVSDNINNNNKVISDFFLNYPNFDCCNLAYNDTCLSYIDTDFENVKRVFYSLSASAYIVSKMFLPKLINNFKEAINHRITNGQLIDNCLDVNWAKLMKISNWYLIKPRLGYQYKNYSDIEKKFVLYHS